MVTWKVVLVVIGIGILLIAIGMWLGYRYISEQDEIQMHNINVLTWNPIRTYIPINKNVLIWYSLCWH